VKFKTHYNLTPEAYRASRSGHFERRRIELLKHAITSVHPTNRILEIGCGTGDILAALAVEFQAVDCCGIDLDDGLVALAQQSFRSPNLTFLRADVTADRELPVPIDFAYSIDVIHHFHEPLETFRAVRQLLRPGATWFAIEPNIWHPYVTWQQERMIRSGFDEGHFRPWRMKPLLRTAGFEVRRVTFAHVFPAALKSVPSWLARLERGVERTALSGASAVYTMAAS
jgi:cyclopropane fatty-acyl-phospholipid synthase-like methyltransferase